MRLLVIDDSVTVRAMVEQVIAADRDCEVVGVAGDIATARALLAKMRPDLLSLDLHMPGVVGMDFLDELAGQRHAIVVLSSSTTDGSAIAREALAHGADACFDKARILREAPRFRRLLRSTVERHKRRLAAAAIRRRVAPVG